MLIDDCFSHKVTKILSEYLVLKWRILAPNVVKYDSPANARLKKWCHCTY